MKKLINAAASVASRLQISLPRRHRVKVNAASGTILVALDDGIATVSINRPHRKNALDISTARLLRCTLISLRKESSVRAILLTGSGDSFCSGGDLSGAHQIGRAARMAAFASLGREFQRIALALRRMPKPVVVALPGPAAGAGLAIVFAADAVIASQNAYLKSNVATGLIPPGGVARVLESRLGKAHSNRVLLAGKILSAAEAMAGGLFTQVCLSAEVADKARDAAELFLTVPSNAFIANKRLTFATPCDEIRMLRELAGSASTAAAIADFHKK